MGCVGIHEDEGNPDDAVEIGTALQGTPITLRRVGMDAAGEVQFGAEEPAVLHRAVLRYLPDDPAPIARFEVKADPRLSLVGTTDHLVLTEAPYHNGWEVNVRFKAGWHGDKDMRVVQIAQALKQHGASRADVPGLHRALASLAFDPFETGRFVTAATAEPVTTLAPKPRHPGPRARWVFGVCTNVTGCQDRLLHSDTVRTLLGLAERQQMDVGPPGHRRRVSGAVKNEASQLMYLAVRQALAGPADDEDAGVPVLKLVEWLFKNHLFNWMRKDDGEPPTESWRD